MDAAVAWHSTILYHCCFSTSRFTLGSQSESRGCLSLANHWLIMHQSEILRHEKTATLKCNRRCERDMTRVVTFSFSKTEPRTNRRRANEYKVSDPVGRWRNTGICACHHKRFDHHVCSGEFVFD